MALCVVVAGSVTALAISAFTLSWTHSIEKTAWEEDWRVTERGLEIAESRVKGSGAGMEPGDGAVLRDGWWVYRPDVPPRPALLLARSGATGEAWTLCAATGCMEIGADAGAPAELRVCEDGDDQSSVADMPRRAQAGPGPRM